MLFDAALVGGGSSSSSGSSASTSRVPEFIAVILADDDESQAGKGDEDPNSLLPRIMQAVDGKPRLDGMLKWVEEGGLTDAVILAPEWQHAGLTSYLRSRKSSTHAVPLLPGETGEPSSSNSNSNSNSSSSNASKPSLRIELDTFDISAGETRSLQAWAERTSSYVLSNPSKSMGGKAADLLVLPSEFMTHFKSRMENPLPPLATMLDRHRLDGNFVTTVLYEKKAPLDKKAKKEAEAAIPLLISYDAASSTLLDIRELEEYEDDVDLRLSLLQRYPVLQLTTLLALSHVYITSRHLLAILSSFPEFKSFEEQALPWLCKAQWQRGLLAKGKKGQAIVDAISPSARNALERSTTSIPRKEKDAKLSGLKIACIVQR